MAPDRETRVNADTDKAHHVLMKKFTPVPPSRRLRGSWSQILINSTRH
jgi:hypothetical protein